MIWAGASSGTHVRGLARLCCIVARLVHRPDPEGLGVERSLLRDPMACECVGFRQEESPWPSGCNAS